MYSFKDVFFTEKGIGYFSFSLLGFYNKNLPTERFAFQSEAWVEIS